ncbi:MAG: cysteine hydrolase family protein [Lysobacter sp.]
MHPQDDGTLKPFSASTAKIRAELLSEMLEEPQRVAVVVIDMQHDFCSPSGAFGTAGIDISANQRIVNPTNTFVGRMRETGAKIIWIKQAASPNHMSPAIMRRLRRAPERMELCKQGTPGFNLADGLKVEAGDSIVEKFRYSAFFGSSLDQILRSSRIQTIVLTGTAANGCVDTTARDGAQMDYDIVIAKDLVGYSDATLASAAITNLDRHFALVCDSSEIFSTITRE